jgi:hypothetical protein
MNKQFMNFCEPFGNLRGKRERFGRGDERGKD